MNVQTRESTSHTTAATGANTITGATSATAVAASGSRSRASIRFHSAWRNAAASVSARADAGMCGGQ